MSATHHRRRPSGNVMAFGAFFCLSFILFYAIADRLAALGCWLASCPVD